MPLRRWAAVVAAVAAAVFVILAGRYAGNSSPGRIDRHSMILITTWGPGEVDHGSALISLGDSASVVLIALVTAGLCLWAGHPRLAVLACLGPGLTGVVTTVSKPLIGRTLDGDFAYPSGHAGGATALGLVAGLLIASLVGRGPVTTAVITLAGGVLAGGIMGYLLSAEDVHYPTDSVGGSCAALVMVLVSALVLDVVMDRWRRSARPP